MDCLETEEMKKDPIDIVAAMVPKVLREVPEGYFTYAEFSARTGMSLTTAKTNILKLYREGKLKRVTVLVNCAYTHYYGLPTQESSDR